MTVHFNFPGQIEFSKTNAQGRKRYKRKIKPKKLTIKNKKSGILAHKEDRDRVKTGVQVAQEGRQWLNTGTRIARLLR